MNSDFAYDQARAFAARMIKEQDVRSLVQRAYRDALARDPSDEELALTLQFIDKQKARTGTLDASAVELARGLFNLNEFLYVD
jgi:hypothetical protein